jgi:hypothetical protein
MRATLLTALGAAHSQGAPGANTNMVCESKQNISVTAANTFHDLQGATKSCIGFGIEAAKDKDLHRSMRTIRAHHHLGRSKFAI